MTDKKELIKLITPIGRASWPALFEPVPFEDGKDLKYRLQQIFDENDPALKPLKIAVFKAMAAEFGKDKAKWPKGWKNPLRSGADKEHEGFGEGTVYIGMSAAKRPGLVDRRLQKILDPDEFYAGCFCRAEVIVQAYKKGGNSGVRFALMNVQKTGEGEAFSGRKDAASVFDAVEDDSDDADNYMTGEDEEADFG